MDNADFGFGRTIVDSGVPVRIGTAIQYDYPRFYDSGKTKSYESNFLGEDSQTVKILNQVKWIMIVGSIIYLGYKLKQSSAQLKAIASKASIVTRKALEELEK